MAIYLAKNASLADICFRRGGSTCLVVWDRVNSSEITLLSPRCLISTGDSTRIIGDSGAANGTPPSWSIFLIGLISGPWRAILGETDRPDCSSKREPFTGVPLAEEGSLERWSFFFESSLQTFRISGPKKPFDSEPRICMSADWSLLLSSSDSARNQ